MKILLVSRSLPFHQFGGMEFVAWDLAVALAGAGHSVAVMTTSSKALEASSFIDGVQIRSLPCPSGRYSFKWWIQSRRTYAEEFAPDTDAVLSVSAGALSLSRRAGRAVFVAQIHGVAWGEFISKVRQMRLKPMVFSIRNLLWMIRDLRYLNFDRLVAVGPAVAKELRSSPTKLLLGRVPSLTIENGVSTAQFRFDISARDELRAQLGLGPNVKVLLSASRLHPQKGVVPAIEAFSIALRRDPNMHFVVAGGGPDEQRIRQTSERLGLAGKLTMVGEISRKALCRYYSAADLFVFTTLRMEGLPTNVLEALACGLQPIVSRAVSLPELPTIAVDPHSPQNIAEAIICTPQTPPHEKKSLLPEKFTIHSAVSAYQRLFAELLGSKADGL